MNDFRTAKGKDEKYLFDIYYTTIGKKKIKFAFQEITNNVYAFFINE